MGPERVQQGAVTRDLDLWAVSKGTVMGRLVHKTESEDPYYGVGSWSKGPEGLGLVTEDKVPVFRVMSSHERFVERGPGDVGQVLGAKGHVEVAMNEEVPVSYSGLCEKSGSPGATGLASNNDDVGDRQWCSIRDIEGRPLSLGWSRRFLRARSRSEGVGDVYISQRYQRICTYSSLLGTRCCDSSSRCMFRLLFAFVLELPHCRIGLHRFDRLGSGNRDRDD